MDKYEEKRATIKAKLKAGVGKQQQEEVLKTSDVLPTAPTPTEKANALKKKAIYMLHISPLNYFPA